MIIGYKGKRSLLSEDDDALVRAVFDSTSLRNIRDLRNLRPILEAMFIFKEQQYKRLMQKIREDYEERRRQ